jgi:hypothetical protein
MRGEENVSPLSPRLDSERLFHDQSYQDNLPIMRKWQDAGFDVNWVNMAGYFNERVYWQEMLKDAHHPNARGESFIADMVNLLVVDKVGFTCTVILL